MANTKPPESLIPNQTALLQSNLAGAFSGFNQYAGFSPRRQGVGGTVPVVFLSFAGYGYVLRDMTITALSV